MSQINGLFEKQYTMSDTSNGVQFPNDKVVRTIGETVVDAAQQAKNEIEYWKKQTLAVQKQNETLRTKLQAYDRVVCVDNSRLLAVYGSPDFIQAIDARKVGEVLEENKQLRISLEKEHASGDAMLAKNEKLRAENERLTELCFYYVPIDKWINTTWTHPYPEPDFAYKLPNEPFWRIKPWNL